MVLTILALLLLAAAPAEGDVIHDSLDKSPQSPPWSWVREEAEGHRVAGGKTLEIAALRGTLWRARNDAKNLLVRPWPADAGVDAEITVTVTFAPQVGGEQAGVMLYFGDDDYVKLVRESLDNKRWIVMGREQKADGQQIAKVEEVSDSVTLHLTRRGDKIEGSYESGAQDRRIPVGACDLPQAEGEMKIALFSHGGPAAFAEARWAALKDFRVTKLTSK